MVKSKILHIITQSEWGGAQRHVFDVARALQDEYQIAVACGGSGLLVDKLKSDGVRVFPLQYLLRRISPTQDRQALSEIRALLRHYQPDLVHTHSTKAEILGNLAARLERIPCVFTAHGFVFNEPMCTLKRQVYVSLERWANTKTKKIICVSEYDRQSALRERIVSEEKLVVIHNGVDPCPDFSRGKTENKMKKSVIGTVANLYPNKGLEYLIDAVSLVNAKHSNSEFCVIGEGKMRGYLETLIAQKRIKNMKLLGFRENVLEEMKRFDVFVLPSLKEGFPYAILEAMSVGLPIVATRVGGIPEAIENGVSGLLVDPARSQPLASAISRLLDDTSLADQFGTRTREIVRSRFSLQVMARNMKNLYNEILNH